MNYRPDLYPDAAAFRYWMLLSYASDAVFIMDRQGRLVEYSERARSLLGYSAEEMSKLTVFDWDMDITEEEYQGIVGALSAEPVRIERRHKRRDASVYIADITAVAFEMDSKLLIYAAVRDVTAEKELAVIVSRQAKELAEREATLIELINSLNAGVVVHAADTKILMTNDRAAEMLGLTKDEALGRHVGNKAWRFVDASLRTLTPEQYPVSVVLATGQPLKNMLFGIERPGEEPRTWVLVNGAPLKTADGGIDRIIISFVEITELHDAEQRLRQAAAVFNNTAEGVTITDLDGTIIDVNKSFTAITGYERDEVVGRNPRMLQSGRHDRSFYQAMWQALLSNGVWRGEIWNRRKNGIVYPELLTISAVREADDRVSGYVGVFADITTIKQTEARLNHLAHHDPLTGLPNRLLFDLRLSQSIRYAQRNRSQLAVVFIDLDRFKNVNDSLGHPVGDQLLQAVAGRLQDMVRAEDTVSRISGDEFVVLLEAVGGPDSAAVVVEKMMNVFRSAFRVGGQEVFITASMGVSVYPQDGEDGATLISNADAAMYRAKEEGRNTCEFYTAELTAVAFEHVFFESALRTALAQGEFRLAYQPQVDLHTGHLIGMEALLRWHHPEQGVIPPARFIPVAEQSGLIRDIGAWVLEEACRQARRWLDGGLEIGRVAVNIAGGQLRRAGFAEAVEAVLASTGLPPQHLELEVTESFVMRGAEAAIDELAKLKALGVEIAIDDFGTGYSSLAYLKQLPVDKLKIDQSFVRDIPTDRDAMAIAEAVIALGRAMDLRVIAEGVELEEQAIFLRAKGCDQAQGYRYGRPLPPQEMERMLREEA